jgi:hypothetical protein
MASMTPVTDENILAQLNGSTPRLVADPAILAQLNGEPQQISTGEDVAKSIGSGLAQGALGVPLGIADLGNSLVAGPQQLGRGVYPAIMKAGKAVGFIPQDVPERTQEELNAEPMWQPFYGSGDAAKELGVDYEPKTMAGKLTSIPAQMAGALVTGKKLNEMANTAQNQGTSFFRNNSSGPAIKTPTGEELRATGGELFQKSEKLGGVLKSHITDAWADDAIKTMPQTNAGKTVFGKNANADLIDGINKLRGKSLTLAEAQELDSGLGDAMMNHVNPRTGKLMAEGEQLRQIQQSLREKIKNAGQNDIVGGKAGFEAWDEGRKHWAASYRMNDIERIIAKADGADNAATIIKNGFRALKNNPSRFNEFNKEEKAAIVHASRSGVVGGALKFAGSRLISSVTGAAAGAAGGGPLGAMAGAAAGGVAGSVPRNIAAKMAASRGNRVRETIAKRVQP